VSSGRWCVHDDHAAYEIRQSFNEWLDSDDDEASTLLKALGMGRFATPSKALFAGDRVAYGVSAKTSPHSGADRYRR